MRDLAGNENIDSNKENNTESKTEIRQRLSNLKNAMKEQGIDLYLIPMKDYHGSEYIGDYFKYIRYFSGFTGSSGTLVVTEKETCLWTDGRYFLQAQAQLEGTDIRLQKMGQKDVPTVTDYIVEYFSSGMLNGMSNDSGEKEAVIGFDGRLVSVSFVKKLTEAWEDKQKQKKKSEENLWKGNLRLKTETDLAGAIWNRDTEHVRPALSRKDVFILDEKFTGKATAEKLKEIREEMEKQGADYLLLTTLDDIAWLTNMRGSDIAYNPVFLSYMIISKEEALLYMRADSPQVARYLKENGISVRNYEAFYEDVKKVQKIAGNHIQKDVEYSEKKHRKSQQPRSNKAEDNVECTIWLDENSGNYQLVKSLPEGCRLLGKTNPVLLKKAVKNPVEVDNERLAHIKDGVAVTKLLYWLKTKVCTGQVSATEITVADYLEGLRSRQENYMGQSFAPIVAYGEHGAIVHYEADEETDAAIKKESLLLLDTGGHYMEGTTDITRTVAMGNLTAQQKTHYTAVLQGNLRLMDARFKKGLLGANLDYLAREPLYRLGLDFNHGTGHGVGYLLNVHEGPNAFRMKQEPEGAFEEGMITSDEPGFYLEGEYGIRLENLIVCVKDKETAYGQFMAFEPLTMVPFDPEAILTDMLTDEDKRLLNAYHEEVYQKLADSLEPEERQWLWQQTRPL